MSHSTVMASLDTMRIRSYPVWSPGYITKRLTSAWDHANAIISQLLANVDNPRLLHGDQYKMYWRALNLRDQAQARLFHWTASDYEWRKREWLEFFNAVSRTMCDVQLDYSDIASPAFMVANTFGLSPGVYGFAEIEAFLQLEKSIRYAEYWKSTPPPRDEWTRARARMLAVFADLSGDRVALPRNDIISDLRRRHYTRVCRVWGWDGVATGWPLGGQVHVCSPACDDFAASREVDHV